MSSEQTRRRLSQAAKRATARRRFQLRFLVLMAAYFGLLFAVDFLLKTYSLPAPLKYLAAIVPAAPMVGVIAALGLYLAEEADEFRRVQLVQAMLWGIGLTLAVTTVWGFLESFAGAPRLPLSWVFPIFCLGMGAAHLLIRRWYR
ncbi:hypothetical protein [Phenylobacterium sp.]|uniref:hypothetical protein n=1 Tax=Phenylobacterium sp. TaxID=1871053 RepID=UPI002DF101AC|nr:hypothetical protein [Phenylobacterium sp.]